VVRRQPIGDGDPLSEPHDLGSGAASELVPCSLSALAEPLPGTAPHAPAWVLVEHPGPWARDAVAGASWPDGLGVAVREAAEAAGVRVVLARRHRARPTDRSVTQPRVVVARMGPGGWTATLGLTDIHDLAGLDWAELAGGERIPRGWRDAGPSWAVCTHGVRDACCARWGRPLAAALSAASSDGVWEISHTGGHRFAGVLVALPEGTVYGRVAAGHVPDLLRARARSEVVPRLLRGRSHLAPWQQAAEAALRRHLDEPGLDAFTPRAAHPLPSGAIRTVWAGGGQTEWWVDVVTAVVPERRTSCGVRPEPGTT